MCERGFIIDILQLIDRLEELLDSGWRVPLSKKVAIEEDAFLNIVDQMRITVPQEIKQAREVALERDKHIAQAHEEARRIIAQAREDAARQLDEHALRAQAEERASAVLRKAVEEATQIRAGADEYAEGKLRELSRQLDKVQEVVQNGIATIEDRRTARQRPGDASASLGPDQPQATQPTPPADVQTQAAEARAAGARAAGARAAEMRPQEARPSETPPTRPVVTRPPSMMSGGEAS